MKKGFEWGHCFKIDHLYTKPQKGYFTDKDGKRKLLWMGSYGIGIERSMACIVESHHDKRGITWPASVAPYQAHLVGVNLENKKVKKAAEDLYQNLLKSQIEVLYDDREEVTAGVKFNDADLIGIPIRLVVSEETLKQESMEIKRRDKKETELVRVTEVVKKLNGK